MQYKINDQEFKAKLTRAILDKNARFVFIPFASLKETILNGSDKNINLLPAQMKATFLSMSSDQSIYLDNNFVLNFIEGKLDRNNEYLMKFGEIRVITSAIEI